jgi:fatty acid desaturase
VTPYELSAASNEPASRGRSRVALEVPTLLVAVAAYGGWLAVTLAYGRWPLIIVAPLAAVLITLHGSLQHEVVHGHPTRWPGINRLLAIVPLSLYLPYERYRESHLIHHTDERLTDPLDDPESYYWTPEDWARLSPLTRTIVRLQQSLAGRVTIGALWAIGRFWYQEWHAIIRNDKGVRAAWLDHLLWCVPVLMWVKLVCGIPVWLYFFTMAVPGTSITLIRSFAEHRARPGVRERIAIVEDSWILGPLFLFNNLHALHHETPGTPWYQLPGRYQIDRARLIAANHGLVYSTYFDVARRFLFRAHDTPLHPSGRVPLADN